MKKILLTLALAAAVTLTAGAQIFYKVEGNGLKEPSYIFGTHHFAPVAMLDSLPQVAEAFSKTSCVVGELVMGDDPMALVQAMQPHMMAPADSTLRDVIPAADFAKADSVFASLTGGIRLDMFNTMKPTVAQTTIMAAVMQKEFPDAGQLDTYFQTLAKNDSKQVAGLETADFQATVLFDMVPVKKQAEGLLESLNDPEKFLENSRKLNDAYLNRDADALWKIALETEGGEDEFFEILLDRRNEEWLSKLPGMMREQPLFVAVGALHLLGDQGVVNGLRKQGFKVTPIL